MYHSVSVPLNLYSEEKGEWRLQEILSREMKLCVKYGSATYKAMFLIYLQVALDIFGGILQRWHPSFCNVFNETKVYVIIRTSSNCLHGENSIGDV